MGPVQGDGLGYREKVFWGSKDLSAPSVLHPDLLVLGTRLDVHGRSADIPIQPMPVQGILAAGCWQITGSYRRATLSFVVWVEP